MTEISFKNFRNVMIKRHRSVDDLVDLFHGKLDENRAFFERVWSKQFDDVIIPYRSVLKFYSSELYYLEQPKNEGPKH